jgi:maltooligosyltrehalose synthase
MDDIPGADRLLEWTQQQNARAKFAFTERLLGLRRKHEALFAEGDYEALTPEGTDDDVWLTFARHHENKTVVAVVPRFPRSWRLGHEATLSLPDRLARNPFADALTGTTLHPDSSGRLALQDLPLPWAVLVGE